MKLFTLLLCFYMSVLSALPTVKAVKSYWVLNCNSSCPTNPEEKENPKSCQKEKCILNFNINATQYLVNHTPEFQLDPFLIIERKSNNWYTQFFISKYKAAIWHPPETISIFKNK